MAAVSPARKGMLRVPKSSGPSTAAAEAGDKVFAQFRESLSCQRNHVATIQQMNSNNATPSCAPDKWTNSHAEDHQPNSPLQRSKWEATVSFSRLCPLRVGKKEGPASLRISHKQPLCTGATMPASSDTAFIHLYASALGRLHVLYQIVASSDKNDIAGGFIKEIRNVLKYELGQKGI
ncbi:hypothetical protein Anapl_10409 [Anas platyrhynchos]|uniref:Uncharacterized protein n=1 Tax=Anas platyrhynchos TaxID=8839 RepID=R0LI84_ANAPL|nr:hypothetical protein Anapl_10409 [Anas platyrhynchos]